MATVTHVCDVCRCEFQRNTTGPAPKHPVCSKTCRHAQSGHHSSCKINPRQCEHCDEWYVGRRRGAGGMARFCSPACRSAMKASNIYHLRCIECDAWFVAQRPTGQFCSGTCDNRARDRRRGPRPARGWRTILCEWCGKPHVTRTTSTRSCSTTCSTNLRSSEQPGGWVCPVPEPPATPVHYWDCEHCGRTVASRRRRKFCTERCRHAAAGRLPDRTDVTIADCEVCGKTYCRPTSRGARFCSKRCMRREGKVRRKKGLATPSMRRKVLERDGWRCHLCGKKIPDRPFKNRANDPTVDHLIPRSAGCCNEMSNLAAAHFLCNSTRCTDGAAQLRLIG